MLWISQQPVWQTNLILFDTHYQTVSWKSLCVLCTQELQQLLNTEFATGCWSEANPQLIGGISSEMSSYPSRLCSKTVTLELFLHHWARILWISALQKGKEKWLVPLFLCSPRQIYDTMLHLNETRRQQSFQKRRSEEPDLQLISWELAVDPWLPDSKWNFSRKRNKAVS